MMQAANNSVANKLTNVLFAHMRGDLRSNDREGEQILRCPRCADRLDAVCLNDFVGDDGITYQHIWWACRGMKDDSCDFPSDMPAEVFWVKRTVQQRREGFIPLPAISLLPKEYRSLYPGLFPKYANGRTQTLPQQGKTNVQRVDAEPEMNAEVRSEHSLSSRSSSPSSVFDRPAQLLSRCSSRLSMSSNLSSNSSNASKHKSVEERLPSPERAVFKKLCKAVAPLCRTRESQEVPVVNEPESSQQNSSSVDETPVSKERIDSVFEGLTDIAEEEENDDESVGPSAIQNKDELLKKLAKPAVPGVPEIRPKSPNSSRPISTTPHPSSPSPCLETLRRETVVQPSPTPVRRSIDSRRYRQAAIERRTQKISNAISSSIPVKNLDNVHIREDANRKRVDLFNGPESSLQSLLYMRYAPEEFLHAVQRKLTKEGLAQPFTAMTPQQKRMASEMADSIRKEHGSNKKGPSWLERTKLAGKRPHNRTSESEEAADVEEVSTRKRTKPDLTRYIASENEQNEEVGVMTSRKLRAAQRPTVAHLKEHMLERVKATFAQEMSSRIGLTSSKINEEKSVAPHVTPPRVPSTCSDEVQPIPGTTSQTTVSSGQSTSTAVACEDDLSDIPASMRLTQFEDPELDALVLRKTRKICQENIIYDKSSNLLYVPANVNYVVPNEAEPLDMQSHLPQTGEVLNEPEYMPSGLAADPNADFRYDEYGFLDQQGYEHMDAGTVTSQTFDGSVYAQDGTSSDGMWHDLGFGLGGMDATELTGEDPALVDEFGFPVGGNMQGLPW